ncbi:hypothetical protein CG723_44275 [Streptomyces sp. CB01635]|uniref:hypothetical protein n=1 Tax=unclassified Streptomyces TaxID=2593676 RepID=UPI000C275F9F|nr:hypothetical protein [Streptomyces sp. CB01635]PJN05535.1 hypothetical protein CG723_44275 [Streptomyces sp. CB01635]
MNRAVEVREHHVEIPGICFIRQPEGALRCTLSAGHGGENKHSYSGPLRNGFRVGTTWPRRSGEAQAD